MRRLTRSLETLGEACARLPDRRRGHNTQYTMPDIGLAALSVFVMQSPSFLAHQRTLTKGRGRSNAHTLFGLQKIPCDNPIRQLLDGVSPSHFDALFRDLVDYIDQSSKLDPSAFS